MIRRSFFSAALIGVALGIALFSSSRGALAANIDPQNSGRHYAYGENIGWITFKPALGPGVTVSDSTVSGFAWSELAGWIDLDPTNCQDCGVANDGSGRLLGWAWGQQLGWISFSCENTAGCNSVSYGVSVDPATGTFSGSAWGENTGWIRFDSAGAAGFNVKTAWRADYDNDGIVNADDPDDDNDGMPDSWETIHQLEPLVDDGEIDTDSDGLSNRGEYVKGSDPNQTTAGPGRAVLTAVADEAANVSLTPELTLDYVRGAVADTHVETGWQISTDSDFDTLVLDVVSADHLTWLTVPHAVLKRSTVYFFRARFHEADQVTWMWSPVRSFTTLDRPYTDDNDNRIPDDQEVDPALDLDGDGMPDVGQTGIKCVDLPNRQGQICIKIADNVQAIESLMWVDPDTIPDSQSRPLNLPLGLFSFRLVLKDPQQPARVTVFCSFPLPADFGWIVYDTVNGWQDYDSHAVIDKDRHRLALEFTDGAPGDADGTVNGVIADPSGPSFAPNATIGGNGDLDVCFIGSLQ